METQRSVLIVEDEAGLSLCLEMLLAKEFRVKTANTGEKALSILTQETVDLILLDIGMPDISGVTLFQSINAICKKQDLPLIDQKPLVVVTTAYGDSELLNQLKELGMIAYLEKPYSNQTLLETIASLKLS